MKKLRLFFSLIAISWLMLCIQVHAQTEDRPIWIAFQVGHQEYKGDFGSEFLEFDISSDLVFGYALSAYLNPSFDVDLSLNFGQLDKKNAFNPQRPEVSTNSFSKTFINTNAMIRYKLSNGYFIRKRSFIQPYFQTGVGVTLFTGDDREIPNGVAFSIPATAGLDIPVSERVKLYLQTTYNRTFSDKFDGSETFDNVNHDDFIFYTVGVKVALSGSRGLNEDNTRIPNPDKIPISDDVRHPAITKEKPDTVKVVPRVPIPVSDLPETDYEVKQDSLEKDSVATSIKKPVSVSEDIQNELVNIAANTQFSNGDTSLEKRSFDGLNRLAEIMKNDENLKLIIQAYTDSEGKASYNLQISKKRADMVKKYLMSRGISADRLRAEGYGEILPVASNDTAQGRRENRRIELRLTYY